MQQDDQFSGSNTPNAAGLFLAQMSAPAMTEDRKEEKNRLKLIRASADPYEAFKEDDYMYPTKEDEMSFWQKYSGENLQGMPILPTGKCSLFCNMVCCFYFLIFGLVFIGISGSITEISLKYSELCKEGTQCLLHFTIDANARGPIFLYYQLEEFYQSHIEQLYDIFSFSLSISQRQMAGYDLTEEEYDTYCSDVQTFEELERASQFNQSTAGFLLNLNHKVNPCGIAAKYIFNDTFQMFEDATENNLYLNSTLISFTVDRNYKYKRNQFFQFRQWLDVEDERVINWFNIQSLPVIRKLWGRYDGDFSVGNYTLVIRNNYPVNIFGGTKTVIITNLSTFGSKNYSFGILLIVTSGIQFICAIIIFSKHKIIERKELQEQKVHVEMKLKEKSD